MRKDGSINHTDSRELFTGTDAEREAARQIAEAERLSAVLRSARPSIDRATGLLERESPMFFGQGENPCLF